MPSYNRARELLGLPTYNSWAELTPDTEIQAILADLYGPDGIDMLDPYVGGLLESASTPFPLFPAFHFVHGALHSTCSCVDLQLQAT
jgi:hypothetical protein